MLQDTVVARLDSHIVLPGLGGETSSQGGDTVNDDPTKKLSVEAGKYIADLNAAKDLLRPTLVGTDEEDDIDDLAEEIVEMAAMSGRSIEDEAKLHLESVARARPAGPGESSDRRA
jgi:hypothetical protein